MSCVLCDSPETCRCPRCHTSYCSDEHRRLDAQFGHSQRCVASEPRRDSATQARSDPRLANYCTARADSFDGGRYLVDDPAKFGEHVAYLGKGSYGTVDFRCDRTSNAIYAVKEFASESARSDDKKSRRQKRKKKKKPRETDADEDDTSPSSESPCDGNALRELSISRNVVGKSLYLAETKGAFVGKYVRDGEKKARRVSLLAMRLETGMTIAEDLSLLGVPTNPKLVDSDDDVKAHMMGALRALAALHRVGVAHLDVKGNNIMVSGGRAVLMDLGLAWTPWTRGRRSPTRVFNAEYRPPECCLDAIDQFDPAMREKGDVWALGCVFLMAVLGRSPFAPRPRATKSDDAVAADVKPTIEEENFELARSALRAIGRVEEWQHAFSGSLQRWTPTVATKYANAARAFASEVCQSRRVKDGDDSSSAVVFDALRDLGLSEAFVDLVREMLDPDPTRRTSAARGQAHPFFDSVRARLSIESVSETLGASPAADELRDKRWAVGLIEKMQLPASDPNATPDFARGEKASSFASDECDSVQIEEKAWSFFHRWNSRLKLGLAERGVGMSTSRRFATCKAASRTLFGQSGSVARSKIKTAGVRRDDVEAMLIDLDHDIDRPTPIDCVYLVLYCSKLRAAVSDLKIGFDAFAHALTVATILAGRMVHDPGMVVGELALSVAALCIAYGLESVKAMHPSASCAVESVKSDAIVPTTDSCAAKFVAAVIREFPGGPGDVVAAMTEPLRATFFFDVGLDRRSIDMQISNAVMTWATPLFQ